MQFTNNISETLLIPLYFRHCENLRAKSGKKAILKDEYATQMIQSIPYNYTKFDSGKMSAIGCIIRADYFDKKIENFIIRHKNAVVIHGGCGLETRFERLVKKHSINPITNFENTIFYEVDLPQVISLRKQFLMQSPNDIFISASLLESNWLQEIKEKHTDSSFIITLEGVAMYFTKEQLATLLQNFAILGEFELWVDFVGSVFAKQKLQHDTIKKMEATFASGIDSPSECIALLPNADSRILATDIYMRYYPLRWGIGCLLGLLPKKIAMKFSFLCGIQFTTESKKDKHETQKNKKA